MTASDTISLVNYPDDFDSLPLPGEPGHDELPDNVKLSYRIYVLEAEVNNGGFHQFFCNSSGAYTPNTVEALVAIGANRTSEILQEAIRIAYPTGFPEDPSLHEDVVLDDDLVLDQLNDLDSQFYTYDDDLTALVNDYLKGDG